MKICDACANWIKKTSLRNQINLENSFTKIDGELHLPFDQSTDCSILGNYSPDIIILAGNGAVEVQGNFCCWDILKNIMSKLKIIGPNDFKEPAQGLTWLAANLDFISRTVNFDENNDALVQLKGQIIGELSKCSTKPRDMCCAGCNKIFKLNDSQSMLILTTNWDSGLLSNYQNVIQLHGRCDYPKQA